MAVTRWTFYDPSTDTTTQFVLNPVEATGPDYVKTITSRSTAAPDGKTLLFQGRREPQRLEWTGTILTQAHFEQYVAWFETQNQVRITDDLGRQFWVVIESFRPKRVRAATRPWKHTYSVVAPLVDWPG